MWLGLGEELEIWGLLRAALHGEIAKGSGGEEGGRVEEGRLRVCLGWVVGVGVVPLGGEVGEVHGVGEELG